MKKLDSDTLIAEKIADIAQSVMHLNLESELCLFVYLSPHVSTLRVVCSKSKEEYNDFLWTEQIYYSIDPKNDIGLETDDVMYELRKLEKKLDDKLKQIRGVK